MKWTLTVHSGEVASGPEKGEKTDLHSMEPTNGEDESYKNYLWKWEGLNFMSSYNQQDLKPGILKISLL